MKRFVLFLAALALVLSGVAQAEASTLVTTRAGLGGTDFIDWGQLGPTFTNVASPATVTSNLGVTVTVSQDNNNSFQRRDQGNGWGGNFTNGDKLLWNAGNGPTMTLDFGSTGIAAGGANIQADFFGAFTARLSAYDASNVLLGSVTENGTSNGNGDGSAIFLGLQDSTADIHKLVYSLDSGTNPNDFAINRFDFTTTAPTPEPSTLLIASLAAGAFGGVTWLRRRKPAAA